MGVEKIILTFTLGGKGLRMVSVVLKKKSKTGGLMLLTLIQYEVLLEEKTC